VFNLEDILSNLPDIIGMSGVFIVLWYYFLLQIGKAKAEGFLFSFANLVGSILILISLWFNWNLSSVVIEVAWFLISLCATARALFYYSKKKPKKIPALSPILPKTKLK
jgi:hypothetical protein